MNAFIAMLLHMICIQFSVNTFITMLLGLGAVKEMTIDKGQVALIYPFTNQSNIIN